MGGAIVNKQTDLPVLQPKLLVLQTKPLFKKIPRHPCFAIGTVLYWQGLLKHLGFCDFPMIKGVSLSEPSMLAHNSNVTLSFDCFPPVHVSPLKTCVLFGRQR